jgi:hypothetical protein
MCARATPRVMTWQCEAGLLTASYGRRARRWLPTEQEPIGSLPRGGPERILGGAMSHENVEFLRQGYEALHRGDLETFMALSRERLDPEFVLFRLGRPSLPGSPRDAGVNLGHSRGLGELRTAGGGDRRPRGERSRRGAHSGAWRGQRRAGIPRARGRLDIRWRQCGASTVIHIQSGSLETARLPK